MDITLDVEGYKLNVRAAVIILHNNKILVHRNAKSNHYALIGGRVTIGENSAQTVKREMQEELAKEIELTGYYSTIENFFELGGSKYHEIMFVHKAEFVNAEDKKIEYTLQNVEGKEYLQYEWLDLEKLENYNIVPRCIIDILKNKQFPVHKINDELSD